MSIAAFKRPVFGPSKPSRLALMGIRFLSEEDPTGGGAGGAGGDDNKFTAPATQADLDKIIETRLARERTATADKYKDYDDLKAKAAKVDEAEDKSRTPDQKAVDAAREEGRTEVRGILAEERVNNALKDALKGRALDPAVLVLGFDKKQFIKDGSADSEAITKWVTDNSSEIKTGNGRDPGQGGRDARSTGGSVQAGRDLYDDSKKPTNRKE
jgi:hypothetical protein